MTRSVTMPAESVSRPRMKQYAKKKSKASPLVKAAVKEALYRLAEKKSVLASGSNIAITTAQASVPTSISLQPTISQGTAQNQRVGNQVRVVSCSIQGHINCLPYNALTNPLGPVTLVKIWICRYKLANPASLASTDVATAFFDTGAGTSGLLASMLDMHLFPNQDSWEIVTTKTLKLGAASGTTSTPSTNSQLFDNSPATAPFRFEFGKKLGMCLYNDTTSNPTNKNLFFVVQPITATGASGLYTPVELHYSYRCEYIDV